MSEQIVPVKTYCVVFATCVLLALANIGLAFLHIGVWRTVISVTLAFAEVFLIILYFMHVRYSSRLTWIVAGAGFAWLALLLVAIVTDVLTRP